VLTPAEETTRRDALRRAADAARLAPSIHNTQPWRFRITADGLDVLLDHKRTLCVIDPEAREAIISCGAALLNARAALARDGFSTRVRRLPHGPFSPVLAHVALSDDERESDLARLAPAIRFRSTNRRAFDDRHPSRETIARWCAAAAAEDSILVEVQHPHRRRVVAALSRRADALETADPAYRAELRAWTGTRRGRRDGVPDCAIPPADSRAPEGLALRDFDVHGTGTLPTDVAADSDPTLLVLGSTAEDPLAWLRVGEALERILLDMAAYGWSAGPFSQALEMPPIRIALARELNLAFQPQLVIRVGRALPQPAVTPRRPLNEVLIGPE
jgi:nitroreductase